MIASSSSSLPGSERLRVGIDLVQISRIRESIATFGERFAQRLFTPDEIAYASAEEPLAAERFAARFAAKEAVVKALPEASVASRTTSTTRRRSRR